MDPIPGTTHWFVDFVVDGQEEKIEKLVRYGLGWGNSDHVPEVVNRLTGKSLKTMNGDAETNLHEVTLDVDQQLEVYKLYLSHRQEHSPAKPTSRPPIDFCEPDITQFTGDRTARFPTLTAPSRSVGDSGPVAASAVSYLLFTAILGALEALPVEGPLAKVIATSVNKLGLIYKSGGYIVRKTNKPMPGGQAAIIIMNQVKKDLHEYVAPTLDRISKGIKHPNHANDGISRPDLKKYYR